MSNNGHFTTRRGFVGAMGFGALGLYATWAAYGASPLPFSFASTAHDGHDGGRLGHDGPMDGHGGGHGAPAVADAPSDTRMTPVEFTTRHADFVRTHRQADGSVRPTAPTAHHDATPAMSGHDHGAASPDHGDHGPAMAMDHSGHGSHGATPAVSTSDGHAGHGAPAASAPSAQAEAPIEVYLTAGRFAFEPDDLRLEKGRTYRFHMMATDVAHGASIAFGSASRIVRLHPDTVTTLDLTFREAGRRLVYCTVYCGLGHDAMHASITVA